MSNVVCAAVAGLVVGLTAGAFLTMPDPVKAAAATASMPSPELTRAWSPAAQDCYRQCLRQIAGTTRYFVLQTGGEPPTGHGGMVMPEFPE